MTKKRTKRGNEAPEAAKIESAGIPSALLSSSLMLSSKDLMVLEQTGLCTPDQISILVEQCAKDRTSANEDIRATHSNWVKGHNAIMKTRCGNCGISAFAIPNKCPFCGDALQGKTLTPVVTFTSGSGDKWNSLCGSFPTIELVMLCLGVPLLFIGLVVLATTSLR